MKPRFDPELLLMEVNGLTVEFDTPDGTVHAVTDVSYRLHRGETLAILGESGSGKSVSVQAIYGIGSQPSRSYRCWVGHVPGSRPRKHPS